MSLSEPGHLEANLHGAATAYVNAVPFRKAYHDLFLKKGGGESEAEANAGAFARDFQEALARTLKGADFYDLAQMEQMANVFVAWIEAAKLELCRSPDGAEAEKRAEGDLEGRPDA